MPDNVFIKDHEGNTLSTGLNAASVELRDADYVLLVNYTKGTEGGVTMTMEVYSRYLGDWYPYQIQNGSSLDDYTAIFINDKHYLVLPDPGPWFDKVRLNFQMTGDLTTPGTITINLLPHYVDNLKTLQ